MDRKTYIKKVYAGFWLNAREEIYGFPEYDKCLCNYISKEVKKGGGLLEVAIGTGYPFADYFEKNGYQVYGIDIAPKLINKCRKLNPRIISEVGDAESLRYADESFDCSYCFHSTWLFPNVNKVINEMIRVTRQGGGSVV